MGWIRWHALISCAALLCGGVQAADEPPPAPAEAPPAETPAPPPPPEAAAAPPASDAPKPAVMGFEGALGPVFNVSPEYAGGAKEKFTVVPGFYLRYGRVSISNASNFVTRRADDVFRGLGLDLKQNDQLRLNLALRLDNGRRATDSAELNGLNNVERTIRARASATRQLGGGWKIAAGFTTDLLGRGGGQLVDLGLSHDRRLSPRTTWSASVGASWASARYMQSYYGVTPGESVASGYPVYTPGSGMRDASIGTGWRMEIDPQWVAFWGGSLARQLGPALNSPVVGRANSWTLNGGIARRF